METNQLAQADFDSNLIGRMNQLGPRYTSYPTADRFTDAFNRGAFSDVVANLRQRGNSQPLSLYVHVPFCDTVCYYCACNKIVTKNRDKAVTYLDYLKREMTMQGKLFAGMNKVEQLHFGGGTPTYINDDQMDDLLEHLHKLFTFAADEVGEYSIEVDPRSVTRERIFRLREQGFNRISLGVQDFDPQVQIAVNRVQPEQQTLAIIGAAREAGFRSISIDLIYGLPKQNLVTMEQTIAKVIEANPDRLSIYNYAHMPHLFKPQRRIADEDLPNASVKLDMLGLCVERLVAAGYVYIGMDHFARPEDDLAIAQREGRLHRNFQGYSTHADSDLVSFGVSAISAVAGSYSQNFKSLEEYYAQLDNAALPVMRGFKLTADDMIRREIIQQLMCNFALSIDVIEQEHPIQFVDYFEEELVKLRALEHDGLLSIQDKWLRVTAKGRFLIRNICMVFDRHLNTSQQVMRYSKTI